MYEHRQQKFVELLSTEAAVRGETVRVVRRGEGTAQAQSSKLLASSAVNGDPYRSFEFSAGPLGMDVTSEAGGVLHVTALVSGGQAWSLGIERGDVVVGLNGKLVSEWLQEQHCVYSFAKLVQSQPRPIVIDMMVKHEIKQRLCQQRVKTKRSKTKRSNSARSAVRTSPTRPSFQEHRVRRQAGACATAAAVALGAAHSAVHAAVLASASAHTAHSMFPHGGTCTPVSASQQHLHSRLRAQTPQACGSTAGLAAGIPGGRPQSPARAPHEPAPERHSRAP